MRLFSPQGYALGAVLAIAGCTSEILDPPGLLIEEAGLDDSGGGDDTRGGSATASGGRAPGGSFSSGGVAGRSQTAGTGGRQGSVNGQAGSSQPGPSTGSGGRNDGNAGAGGTTSGGSMAGSPTTQAGRPEQSGGAPVIGAGGKAGSTFGSAGAVFGMAGRFGQGGSVVVGMAGMAGRGGSGNAGSFNGNAGKGGMTGSGGSPSGVAGMNMGNAGSPPVVGNPTCNEPQGQVCNNQIGKHCGYTFEYWKDSGSGCMTNKADGFSVEWNNINNLLGRKGVRPGTQNNVVTYESNYQPNGNSYLCVYGWSRGPLVEYYIVDSWGTWRPPGGMGFMGTLESDGATYDIYRTQRVNQPSIDGNATFYQYWSVRQQKRTSGTITVGNHFRGWASKGMNIGNLYEVSMTVEGYQSSGRADVKMSIR